MIVKRFAGGALAVSLAVIAVTGSPGGTVGATVPMSTAACRSWSGGQPPQPGGPAAAISARDIWAVGFDIISGTGDDQTLVEHWDGTAWMIVPSPDPGSSTILRAAASEGSISGPSAPTARTARRIRSPCIGG
jgi:hypothetical protein